MKIILLSLLAIGAFALTGCETTVVEHRPGYHHAEVYYSSGRPYYYTGGVRYWGYPAGYSGYRSYGYSGYGYRPAYSTSYRRNVEIERNTYIVNNNRTVYNNRYRTPSTSYRSNNYRTQSYQSQGYRTQNVKVKGVPPGQAKKKKKHEST